MITIFICICIEYDTPYAIILTIFGISVACDPYFVDTFALSESNSLWVPSIFHFFLFYLDMGHYYHSTT